MIADMNPIAKYREDSGKSREDMASEIAVDPTTIWRWETGRVPIPVERLADVERITGIPRNQLRPDIFGEATT